MKTRPSSWHVVIQVVCLISVWSCYVSGKLQCSSTSSVNVPSQLWKMFVHCRSPVTCPDKCFTCSNNTYCTQCESGFYGTTCEYLCNSSEFSDSKNGRCSNTSCIEGCADGYYGTDCQYNCPRTCRSCSSSSDCIGCTSGYYGTTCQYSCPKTCIKCSSSTDCTTCTSRYYGSVCQNTCNKCLLNTCHKDNGQCTEGCVDAYYQPQGQIDCVRCPSQCIRCNSDSVCTACQSGYYGPSCGVSCDQNCRYRACELYTGLCTNGCEHGYYQNGTRCIHNCQRDFCQTCTSDELSCSECQNGYYIDNGNCAQCKGGCLNGKCDRVDGSCSEGCKVGLTSKYCNDQCNPNCIACEQYSKETCTSCKAGYHGKKCENACNTSCQEVDGVRQCAKTNGECTHGCENGYTGSMCSERCSTNCMSCDQNDRRSCDSCFLGFYGQTCDGECSSHCRMVNNTIPCFKDTGECLLNCTQGYRGPKCDIQCEAGCQDECGRDTGTCDRCKTLYYGPLCEHKCNYTCYNPNNGSNVCDKQMGNCSFEYSASQSGVQSGQESASESDNNLAIIGAATGSVIAVLIIVVRVILLIMMRRKRKKTSNPEPGGVERNIDAVYSVLEKNRSSKRVESTDVEVPDVDNYYNIYDLTRSRIQLDELNNYVSSKTAGEFEKEFKKLQECVNRSYDDVSPKIATKNRYKGIYPYDATRVKLEGSAGDYINASYIEGFGELEKTYIASLGPTKRFVNGCVDFWRMVWQENVDKIVMLTNFADGTKEKYDKYWPEVGQTETYGHVVVECINVETFADFNISKLNVSTASNHMTTAIHHFHFTAWPVRGTPSNVVSLVEFRESVERVKSTTQGPIVFHCSAGIGRTGTYIALDILTRAGQTEGYVDIVGCVLSLRRQRVGMVQNVDQYRYLHHAIEHSLTTKCEQIENGNFCGISADQIDEVFHLLKGIKYYKDEKEIKAMEKNKREKHRNRKGADIPGDAGRPKLSNHHKETQSQYINAVYVDSYKQTNKYILAQTPLSGTVEDFLGLVLQENCSCIISLDDTEHTRKQDIGLYVPAGKKQLSVGKSKVKVISSQSTPEYELRYITIDEQGTGADESKTIPHYQFKHWPANSLVPASVDSFLNLIGDIERTIRDSGKKEGPVLVHCLTGAERCGLIPVITNLIEKLDAEQQASVVNFTRQIRARRARAIPNQDQFQFIYSCVKQFIDNSSVYANVL